MRHTFLVDLIWRRWRTMRMKWRTFREDNSGMGTIEVVIIIAILVALALIFRNFIVDLAKDIFDKIESNASSAISDL